MRITRLIWKEILHRKMNFGLSLIAVTIAVAFAVAFFTTSEASKRETIRLMRDMGYNLRIIAKKTDLNRFYATGYSDQLFPFDDVKTFAAQKGLQYAHLLATLHQAIDFQGHKAILTGIAPELSPTDQQKKSMIFTIQPGTVYLGYQLAQFFTLHDGDTVQILGQSFQVAHCLKEAGSEDDIRILAALSDVQRLLHAEGKINEIQALNCYCLVEGKDPLEVLREQLASVLPHLHVIQKRSIADARTKQRELMDNYFALILPIVLFACAAWIGGLAFLNTRDRQQEVGILRALGYRTSKVVGLFLGKAVGIGLIGAVVGFVSGTSVALIFGADIFKVTYEKVSPLYNLLWISLIAAPLFTALSSFIPSMIAATQDPAESLREE